MVIMKKRKGFIEPDVHSASDTRSILIGIVKISRAKRLPIKVRAIKTRWNPTPEKIFDFALFSSIGIVSLKIVLIKYGVLFPINENVCLHFMQILPFRYYSISK